MDMNNMHGIWNLVSNWPNVKVRAVIKQGCCLTGARSPGAPKSRAWATRFLFKEPARAPKVLHGKGINFVVNSDSLAEL